MNRQRVLVNDPYRDWQQVYRQEVIDKIRHWPENRRVDSNGSNSDGLTYFEALEVRV